MSKSLAWIGLGALCLSLVLTFWSILTGHSGSKDFLDLTKTLLSWKVIVGSLAVGGGVTFKKEIKERISRAKTGA